MHQFPEIAEFLHERWAGGGGPNAWVETAGDGLVVGEPGYCHQRVAALRRRGRGCCVVAPIVLHGRAWGELYVARPRGAPVFDADDADFATVVAAVVAAGIAQTERLEEVRRLAFTDPLTGLANRRAVDMRLDEAVDLHRAEDTVVSLVVCDLNGLKKVNDTHGHAVGDRLLERFGSVLSLCGAMLPGALAARLGGDEFCLLAVGPRADEVIAVAERAVRARGELELGEGVACGVASTGDPIGRGALGAPAVPAGGRRAVPGEGGARGGAGGGGRDGGVVRLADASPEGTRAAAGAGAGFRDAPRRPGGAAAACLGSVGPVRACSRRLRRQAAGDMVRFNPYDPEYGYAHCRGGDVRDHRGGRHRRGPRACPRRALRRGPRRPRRRPRDR